MAFIVGVVGYGEVRRWKIMGMRKRVKERGNGGKLHMKIKERDTSKRCRDAQEMVVKECA